MPLHTIQYSFNGGEVSELFLGRTDINRYFSSLGVCENYRTLPKGGVISRDGTQMIAEVKDSSKKVRLERFEFSVEQAYILELGEQYVRFYLPTLARLESGGSPVEVTTPYLEAQLFDLQLAQSADVLYITHPSHPPAKISRLTATSFQYDVIVFRPAPLFEKLTDLNVALTPGAVSGTGVTFTAGSAVFLDADVDRQIVSGTARATITALGASSPSTTVTCTILSPFPSTATIAAGSWVLEGSPVATLRVSKQMPVGAEVTLNLEREQTDQANLVTNGDFSGGATGWTNHSGALLSSGTATSGSDTNLTDTGATFQADGVEVNHIAINKSDAPETQDSVTVVVSETSLTTTADGSTWAASDNYEVRDTGSATFGGGEATLNGGANGFGWIEQGIATVVGLSYQVQFDVRTAGLSLQVGSTSKASDILAELSYNVGNEHKVTFVATSTTTYLQFRNNQNFAAVVDNITVKLIAAEGFRTADVGKLINAANGTIEIIRYTDATQVVGVIWATLDTPSTGTENLVIAGAWVLGEQAWSATNGYPRGLTFHQGRLWFLGTSQQPLTAWGSVSGLFEDFALGAEDDDAVEVSMSANTMNTLEWGEPFRDLFVGTRGGEHLITGGTDPITPNNRAQVPQDTEGSPPLRPLRISNSLMHVSRDRRRVRELTIDADTGLSEVNDLTILADHITKGGVIQWAYQRHRYQQIWGIAGQRLIGLGLELAEDVRGWHRHVTSGTFESVAVCPVENATTEETEQVWLSAKRTIGGVIKRFIEVMRPDVEDATQKRARLSLDSAVRYSGASTTTLTGLTHLEGQTVTMVAREDATITTRYGETLTVDRLINLGTATVSGGQVTAPMAVTKCDVGLPFTPKIETLPPEVQLDDGTVVARKKRWAELFVRLYETISIEVDGTLKETRDVTDLLDTNMEPRTEDITEVSKGWTEDGRITLRQTLPFPSTILAIVGKLEFEEAE